MGRSRRGLDRPNPARGGPTGVDLFPDAPLRDLEGLLRRGRARGGGASGERERTARGPARDPARRGRRPWGTADHVPRGGNGGVAAGAGNGSPNSGNPPRQDPIPAPRSPTTVAPPLRLWRFPWGFPLSLLGFRRPPFRAVRESWQEEPHLGAPALAGVCRRDARFPRRSGDPTGARSSSRGRFTSFSGRASPTWYRLVRKAADVYYGLRTLYVTAQRICLVPLPVIDSRPVAYFRPPCPVVRSFQEFSLPPTVVHRSVGAFPVLSRCEGWSMQSVGSPLSVRQQYEGDFTSN